MSPHLLLDAVSYTALHDHLPADTLCMCSDCGMPWRYDQTKPIGEAHLTPGDASPAGRCPLCDNLTYPSRRKDLERDYGYAAFALLRRLHERLTAAGFGKDAPINGADVVDIMAAEFDAITNTIKLLEE